MITQQLKSQAALAEDPNSVSRTYTVATSPVTPVPGYPMPSSNFYGHRHTCVA